MRKTPKEWAKEFKVTELVAKTIQQEAVDWTLLACVSTVIDMDDELFASKEAKRAIAQALAKVKP